MCTGFVFLLSSSISLSFWTVSANRVRIINEHLRVNNRLNARARARTHTFTTCASTQDKKSEQMNGSVRFGYFFSVWLPMNKTITCWVWMVRFDRQSIFTKHDNQLCTRGCRSFSRFLVYQFIQFVCINLHLSLLKFCISFTHCDTWNFILIPAQFNGYTKIVTFNFDNNRT